MTPYTATDLLRSMRHAYGDSIPTQRQDTQTANRRRFVTWARSLLRLA